MNIAYVRGLLLLVILSFSWLAHAYDYPIDNGLEATVIGTPKAFMASMPEQVNRKDKTINIFPEREIQTVVPRKRLKYSIVTQKKAAPLLFSIAGTGSSHRSAKMRLIEKVFSQAGFHVVSLSSPTNSNFIVTASTTQVPGHIVHDSADLYRVMEAIVEQYKNKIEITEFHITGYSLGGSQAAFVAKLDEERQSFNFKKVLMINPPVNLFNSVSILDQLLEDNVPGGLDNFDQLFNSLMNDFSKIYTEKEYLDFSDDFLYRIYEENDNQLDRSRVSATIGMSFRLASSNMIFTSDIVTNGGYILPKNHELKKTESTTNYLKVASRVSFTDYFYERFYPFYNGLDPEATTESLKFDTSLNSIADYLSRSNKIAVVHNQDDIILAPGEIDFFRDIFKSRAQIYPKGGHCGNMAYKDNVEFMVNYFKN